jgi:hypothetical protein
VTFDVVSAKKILEEIELLQSSRPDDLREESRRIFALCNVLNSIVVLPELKTYADYLSRDQTKLDELRKNGKSTKFIRPAEQKVMKSLEELKNNLRTHISGSKKQTGE